MSGRELLVHGVDLALEPFDLGGDDAQTFARADFLRRGEVGAEIEKIVLDARQHGIEIFAERGAVQTRQCRRRRSLRRSVPMASKREIRLRPPLAGGERAGAVVAGAGVDAVEDDHIASQRVPK